MVGSQFLIGYGAFTAAFLAMVYLWRRKGHRPEDPTGPLVG